MRVLMDWQFKKTVNLLPEDLSENLRFFHCDVYVALEGFAGYFVTPVKTGGS